MSTSVMTTSRSQVSVWIALGLVYVVWGSTYLAIRKALDGGFPPLLMGGVRFLIAGSLMYSVLRLRGVPAPTKEQWKNLAIIGLLLLGLGNGLVCVAEQSVPSGLVAVAVASVPLWVGLFMTLRGQRPSKMECVGLATGFIGIVWLNAGSSLTNSIPGLIALIISPIAWSFGSVWGQGKSLPSPFMSSAGQMLCGGVLLMIAGFAYGENLNKVSWNGVGALSYLIVFGSIIGFSAFAWLLQNVRPTLVSSYAYVNPVIAVLLGITFNKEIFKLNDFIAMGIILFSVVLINLAKVGKK